MFYDTNDKEMIASTKAELARNLSVSTPTVYNMIKRGEVIEVVINSKKKRKDVVYIDRDAMIKFLVSKI